MTPSLTTMTGGPRRLGGTALLLLLGLLAYLCIGDAAATLRLVQVVHRHGSRSPIVNYNASAICGDVPCGHLNVPGQTMLVKAGKALRHRYNNDPAVVTAPFFLSPNFDLDVSHTRSTDVLRTLQSADGLLRGLFPNTTAFYPATHTVERASDLLLLTDDIPFRKLFVQDAQWRTEQCNPWVDAVIDFQTLLSVAREAHSEGFCADAAVRCECARRLFDIGAAMAADGRIAKYPLLKAQLSNLRRIEELASLLGLGYNASDARSQKMGSQGQPLAQQLLENVRLHMQGKSGFKLYHYSAHDTTLSPLAGTLRDATPKAIFPPFAQLYAFELLHDDETNAYSMRVVRGHPGQTPDTGYEFGWESDFQLRCMDSNGEIYDAANNTCPFYDFQRLVDSSKPTDPAGLCYLDDNYKSLLNCPKKAGGELTAACAAYRKVCPAWSCDSGFVLEATTLQCRCADAACM